MEAIITERSILVDTLPDILLMTDTQLRIVSTNRAARAVFGQNLSGRYLKEVVMSDVLVNGAVAVLEDLKGRVIEFRLMEPEPADYRAILEHFPVASAGGISLIVTLNDVTELKRVEKMRADFVANASHEIRTPLASIVGFIETLQGPAKEDESAREQFLGVMHEQAKRMTALVSDLLSLSKIEMNAHSVPVNRVDMLRLARAERESFAWLAKQKNMQIIVSSGDEVPEVRGDENELRQVVHNLIGNAIKYGHENTDIHINVRMTAALPNDPNFVQLQRAVVLSVRDKGEGIAREHLPRLTERFYRVDSARTRKVGGTGLGLAIVKHILNRHRALLAIDSAVGEGSTFSIFLPIYEDVL
jgi:two-component system, OmpR family, phosphate regulon sensor histidine kinase PhoR